MKSKKAACSTQVLRSCTEKAQIYANYINKNILGFGVEIANEIEQSKSCHNMTSTEHRLVVIPLTSALIKIVANQML